MFDRCDKVHPSVEEFFDFLDLELGVEGKGFRERKRIFLDPDYEKQYANYPKTSCFVY